MELGSVPPQPDLGNPKPSPVSVLALVPVLGLIMMFVLGFKGNRWAWEKKDWCDIEHFHSTQRKSGIAGLVWTVGWTVVGMLVAAVGSESEAGALA